MIRGQYKRVKAFSYSRQIINLAFTYDNKYIYIHICTYMYFSSNVVIFENCNILYE